jgi:hypothetical protein
MTTSKPPLQKCIHGSPGNRSRISWDPWSIIWDSLAYKLQAFIQCMIVRWVLTSTRLSSEQVPSKSDMFCAARHTHKVNRLRLQKCNNQDMTSHVRTRHFPLTRDSRENSDSGANCSSHGSSQAPNLSPHTNKPAE